jgi:hypothetical protein
MDAGGGTADAAFSAFQPSIGFRMNRKVFGIRLRLIEKYALHDLGISKIAHGRRAGPRNNADISGQ